MLPTRQSTRNPLGSDSAAGVKRSYEEQTIGRIFSTRLRVLVGILIVMTAALTGLVWAAEPAAPPPAAKAAVSGAGARTSHVREVQQALLAAGYDPGPIDGIMGPRTKSALLKYIAVPPPQIPSPADRALAPFRANERREGQ
jgi:Putative peptidoglycan binding domain